MRSEDALNCPAQVTSALQEDAIAVTELFSQTQALAEAYRSSMLDFSRLFVELSTKKSKGKEIQTLASQKSQAVHQVS